MNKMKASMLSGQQNLIEVDQIAPEQCPLSKKIQNTFAFLPFSGFTIFSEEEKRFLQWSSTEKGKTENKKECIKNQDLSGMNVFQDTPEYAQFLRMQLRQCFSFQNNYQKIKYLIKALQSNFSFLPQKQNQILLLKSIESWIEDRNKNQLSIDLTNCVSVNNLIYNFYQKKTLVQNLESILFKLKFYKKIVLKKIDCKKNQDILSFCCYNTKYLNQEMYYGHKVFDVRVELSKDYKIISKQQFDKIFHKLENKNIALPSQISFFKAIFIYLQTQQRTILRTFQDPGLFYILKTHWPKLSGYLSQKKIVSCQLSNYSNTYFKNKYLNQKAKPRGLKNLGNTCYMNSGLQCLHKTKLLTQYFNQLTLNQSYQDINFLKGYKQLTQQLNLQSYLSFASDKMKKLIAQKNYIFEGYQQHDCCQLINSVINNLHTALNSVKIKVNVPIDQNQKEEERLYNNYKKRDQARIKSIMDDIFFGRFRTSYCCSFCDKEMVLFQKFSIIYLPIPCSSNLQKGQSFTFTLQSCIQKFQEADIMEGSSSWTCNFCKYTKKTFRKMKIYKTNKILVFCLKRFQDNSKIYSRIKYPSSLDVNQLGLTSQEYKGKIYQLYGVVNHFGSLYSGHYTAYCRQGKDQWFEFNDSFVEPIHQDKVLSQSNAYLLFYQLQQK